MPRKFQEGRYYSISSALRYGKVIIKEKRIKVIGQNEWELSADICFTIFTEIILYSIQFSKL